jgi:hypothetical protein
MKKREKWKATGITDAQALAIGHMTITFNAMERSIESFISLIVAPHDYGLDRPLISPLNFGRKLDILKKLVDMLSDHYVQTEENERAYGRFAAGTKDLIVRARALNTFRNGLIHWRYEGGEGRTRVEVSARAIETKSVEMNLISAEMLARAIGVRQGDYSVTFGQQFRQT